MVSTHCLRQEATGQVEQGPELWHKANGGERVPEKAKVMLAATWEEWGL